MPAASAAANPAARVQRRAGGLVAAALTDVEGISCYSRKLPLNSAVIPRSRFRWILLASIDASGKSRDLVLEEVSSKDGNGYSKTKYRARRVLLDKKMGME